MSNPTYNLKRIVATVSALVMISLPVSAQEDSAQDLLQQLQNAEPAQSNRIEKRLLDEWSKSGSPAMDLLLKRGRDALEVQQSDVALEHFGALTDHAPNFAEGWYGMALAYFFEDQLGPALDALEHTLALNPDHFGALQGLATIFEQTEKPKLAHRAYQEVLKLNPHNAQALDGVARLDPLVTGTAL